MVSHWNGRRVFLTGHTGFKGGWLALWLAKNGAQIRGYALDPGTESMVFTASGIGSIIDDVRGDIRDFAKLRAAMAEFRPEVVFHLAAQPLVRHSYADPVATYTTNVIGTVHVLEAVRTVSTVRAVVCVTTDKCYENREWVWPYRESDPLGGYDPYSSSKACAEIVAAAYRTSFFPIERLDEHRVAVATARAGNVIGGGDWSTDRLVPDLIRGFQTGQPVLIRNPKAIRPWQHVLEPLSGYITLSERLLAGEAAVASAFNFGPGDDGAWSVEHVATKLVALWGEGASWVCETAPTLHEANLLKLDSSKSRTVLSWRPRLDVQTALAWTVEWYRRWQLKQDMQQLTIEQINTYENLPR